MRKEKDLRRLEIYERAKRFEEKVAELFRLQGYSTIVDYQRNDMQFDVRLELTAGAIPSFALVECKDKGRPVTQQQVRDLASKVQAARNAEHLNYQAILVAKTGFANNAYAVAQTEFVHLLTYDQLLQKLVDLSPILADSIRTFQGTSLERLYVQQQVVLEEDLRRTDRALEPRELPAAIRVWLDRPDSTFFALLGDFGCGKTSFSQSLACEMALAAKEKPGESRVPVLIDLRKGGSTTVTLENLLTHHFQSLTSQPFNPQALLHLNREGYLLLIFDGFDETIAYTEPGRYLENLRQVLRAAEGKAKVLLTCRTHYFRDRPQALRELGKVPSVVSTDGATRLYEEIQGRPGSEVGYLLEFDDERVKTYLRKALPPPADWEAFHAQIERTYNLPDLAARPFLLDIIVKTLPRLSGRKETVSISDLYETYCASWFEHEDFRLTLTRDRREALVHYLARLVWDSSDNRVHYDVLFEKATEFFKDRSPSYEDRQRIDYEVRTALFLNRDAEGYYTFIHRSFLEFFVAREIRAGIKAGRAECLDLKRITREVAFFLEFWEEAKGIPAFSGGILEIEYRPRISENALFLLYFHARAMVGPLVEVEGGRAKSRLSRGNLISGASGIGFGAPRAPSRGGGPDPKARTEAEIDPAAILVAFDKVRPKAYLLDGAALFGAPLAGIDLQGADLPFANLARADLRQANLSRANLEGAALTFADLRSAKAEDATLTRADLDHCDARGARFDRSSLQDADLSFGRFAGATFEGADLTAVELAGAGFLHANPPAGTITLDSARPEAERRFILHTDLSARSQASALVWSPNRNILATGSDDGQVRLWDVADGRILMNLNNHTGAVVSLAWEPNGDRIASASEDHTIQIWDSHEGTLLEILDGPPGGVLCVAWEPNGRRIASSSYDKTVRIWNPNGGDLLHTLVGHHQRVASICWEPNCKRIASASFDKTIRVWDVNKGVLLSTLRGHRDRVQCVSWEPNGKRLASSSRDSTIRLWDPDNGIELKVIEGHKSCIQVVAWEPNGERIVSASDDRTIRLWSSTDGAFLHTIDTHRHSVTSVAWDAHGKRLATSTSDNTIRLWRCTDWELIATFETHQESICIASLGSTGELLATASDQGPVRIWEPARGLLPRPLAGDQQTVRTVAFEPRGRRLATTANDNIIRVWDSDSWKLIAELEGHRDWVRALAWKPNGGMLASVSDDTTVRLWDIDKEKLLKAFEGHRDSVRAVAWSPEGNRLASGSDDGTVRLWDPNQLTRPMVLKDHEAGVNSLSWERNGNRLASASDDCTVRTWNANTGAVLKVLDAHNGPVLSVSWDPGNGRIVSAAEDKFIRIWDAADGKTKEEMWVGRAVAATTWTHTGRGLLVAGSGGLIELWDLAPSPPRRIARLYHTPNGSGFIATMDGYVDGPPEGLEWVKFGENWALYDLEDVPERHSPERVRTALAPFWPTGEA